MTATGVLVVLVAGALGVLAARTVARRRRDRARRLIELRRHAEGLGLAVTAEARAYAIVTPDGRRGRVPHADLLAVADRAEPPFDAWTARLHVALAPPLPLPGPLLLKLHGPGLLPRLVHEETARYLTRTADAATRGSDDWPFAWIFAVDTDEGPRFLSREHLRAAGVDVRDAHGIAVAVLRQRLEVDLASRTVRDGWVEHRPDDGCGASRILVVAELLDPGETLLAAVPGPDVLLLARSAAGERLRERMAGLRRTLHEPVSGGVFEITGDIDGGR